MALHGTLNIVLYPAWFVGSSNFCEHEFISASAQSVEVVSLAIVQWSCVPFCLVIIKRSSFAKNRCMLRYSNSEEKVRVPRLLALKILVTLQFRKHFVKLKRMFTLPFYKENANLLIIWWNWEQPLPLPLAYVLELCLGGDEVIYLIEAGVTFNDSRSISRENVTTSSVKLTKRSENIQYCLYLSFLIATKNAGIAS